MEDNGDFVVVWLATGYQDPSRLGVFAQRFTSAGSELGGEFRINTFTTVAVQTPSIACDADGDFVVTWATRFQEYGQGVVAQRFASSGAALAQEFRVNTHTQADQYASRVAMNQNGDFVIAWTSTAHQDGHSAGVFAQRFASSGDVAGSEFQVNSYTTYDQWTPSVGIDGGGDFVVAWVSREAQDGSGYGIFAQKFSSSGVKSGGEFQVNTRTSYRQWTPAVAMTADGLFLVVWSDESTPVFANDVIGQRFSSGGARLGGEFRVNAYTNAEQYFPSVAMAPDGDFVVAWSSTQREDVFGAIGIFAQRFACSTSMATALPSRSPTGSSSCAACSASTERPSRQEWSTR